MTEPIQNKNAKIISQVAQYIYDHSAQPIKLDDLAKFTGFSKYHFNRIFFAATGYQLGEFVQRQKLEKALYIIKEGNHNLIDVALSVGYDSQSSFSRAFKKHFSRTPSEVANGELPENLRGGSLVPKKSFSHSALRPRWQLLPEKMVYGLYGKGFNEQSFSQLAGQLYGRLASLAKPSTFDVLQPIGISITNPWVGEQSESTFFAGFLTGLEGHESELESYCWRGGRYACFTHSGPHNTMWQTISQVYAQWVLPNNIKLKDEHIVQLYLNNPNDCEPSDLKTELYFAVEESA